MNMRIFAHHWTKFILACCIVQLGACSASTANLQSSNARNNAAEQINGAKPLVVTGARNELRNGPVTEGIPRPTQIVVLGSGTPIPDAKHASASLALIYQGEAYLFDVGAGATWIWLSLPTQCGGAAGTACWLSVQMGLPA